MVYRKCPYGMEEAQIVSYKLAVNFIKLTTTLQENIRQNRLGIGQTFKLSN